MEQQFLLTPYAIKDFLFEQITKSQQLSCYLMVLMNAGRDRWKIVFDTLQPDITKNINEALTEFLTENSSLHIPVPQDDTFAVALTEKIKTELETIFNQQQK